MPEAFFPKGNLIIAQRFIAGYRNALASLSPAGTSAVAAHRAVGSIPKIPWIVGDLMTFEDTDKLILKGMLLMMFGLPIDVADGRVDL